MQITTETWGCGKVGGMGGSGSCGVTERGGRPELLSMLFPDMLPCPGAPSEA